MATDLTDTFQSLYEIRTLRNEDVQVALHWMVDEQWYISKNMLDSWIKQHPDSCIGIVRKDNNKELLGCIFLAFYNVDHDLSKGGVVASAGCFIVKEESRNKQVGKALVKYASRHIKYLFGAENIAFNCPLTLKTLYEPEYEINVKHFEVRTVHGLVNRELLIISSDPNAKDVEELDLKKDKKKLEDIYEYDRDVHLDCQRRDFLEKWTNPDTTKVYATYYPDGMVSGYGCIQEVRDGDYHIGPLFCDRNDLAKSILTQMVCSIPFNREVSFDITDSKEWLNYFVGLHKLKVEFTDFRFYTDSKVPISSVDKVHILTCSKGPCLL